MAVNEPSVIVVVATIATLVAASVAAIEHPTVVASVVIAITFAIRELTCVHVEPVAARQPE